MMPETVKDCPKHEQLAEKKSFEDNCEIWGKSFNQGHYPPIYCWYRGREGRGYLFYNPPINFYNVRSSVVVVKREKSVGVTVPLRLNKSNLGRVLDFIILLLDLWKLKPEKVTSFPVFLLPIKSDDGYQNRTMGIAWYRFCITSCVSIN